jgi:NhaP-type Na+/H+ or K+/H+ antiporter
VVEVGSLGFAVVGAVLVVAALGVGLVDRSPVSFPLLFAAAGVAIGPLGTGWLTVTPGSRLLCQCFLDFGGAVTEMAMLVTFVLFGAALSPLVAAAPLPAALALAGLLLVVIRPAAVGLVLVGHHRRLSAAGVGLLAWFGPRGLASLLFGLILYDAGLFGDSVFGLVGVVVAVSIVVHGASARPLAAWYGRRAAGVR